VSTVPQPRTRVLLAVARFASLTFAGVFAGFLVTVLVLELSMRSADGSVYTTVRHVELIGLDVLATVLLIPAAVATGVVAAARFSLGGAARWLPLAALLLLVSVFVLTFAVNLPINADQHGWVTPPPDWASVRDRWQLAHAARTVAAVLAFGCLGLGEIRAPARGSGSRALEPSGAPGSSAGSSGHW
jgi:anthrone oxygenase-like protein